MFEQVPILKRWRYIIGMIAFVFLFSLFYAAQVWRIYAKIEELEGKTALARDADLETVNRQVELKRLSDGIRNMQASGKRIESHVQLMQYIEQYCAENSLRIIQLPKEGLEDVEGYEIAKVEFSVEGSFHDILRLVHQLESKDGIGSIDRAQLELKTVRVGGDQQRMLIGSISLNRLIHQSEKRTLHENS
jgi:hypothetical protein